MKLGRQKAGTRHRLLTLHRGPPLRRVEQVQGAGNPLGFSPFERRPASLVPQRLDRVEPRRAPRREVAEDHAIAAEKPSACRGNGTCISCARPTLATAASSTPTTPPSAASTHHLRGTVPHPWPDSR